MFLILFSRPKFDVNVVSFCKGSHSWLIDEYLNYVAQRTLTVQWKTVPFRTRTLGVVYSVNIEKICAFSRKRILILPWNICFNVKTLFLRKILIKCEMYSTQIYITYIALLCIYCLQNPSLLILPAQSACKVYRPGHLHIHIIYYN